MATQQSNGPRDESRRRFLKYSGAAVGGVVVGGVIGGAIGGAFNKKETVNPPGTPGSAQEPAPTRDYNQALMFFSQEQFAITVAAAERIFPKDELGPGAKELGAAYFIDHQMAGQWGMNARDYMTGPFFKAEVTQGYQSSFRRHELVTLGLQALTDYSGTKYKKKFTELTDAEQDEVLKVFDKGDEVQIKGISSKLFFNLLCTLTYEGVYSDPLYGGNKEMLGWKMKQYPGDQMSYLNEIDKTEFITMEPVSLHDHMSHT